MSKHSIAVIAGDGIGTEVIPEGLRVLEAAATRFGFELAWTFFDWSCETGPAFCKNGLEDLLPLDRMPDENCENPGEHDESHGLLHAGLIRKDLIRRSSAPLVDLTQSLYLPDTEGTAEW